MPSNLLDILLGKDLARQVKDWKRARDPYCCTTSEDGEVPMKEYQIQIVKVNSWQNTHQPHTSPIMPKLPPIFNSNRICSKSAAVVAVATAKSAAAMNANSITKPKNVKVKRKLTLKVQIRKTKLASTL